jgi:hypothetical protein
MAERELELRGAVPLAEEIAGASVIDIGWLFAGLVLLGVLYALKYIVVPLVKMLYPKGGSLLDRIASWAIGSLLAPVAFIVHAVTNAIATGIDHHAGKVTVWLHAIAFEVHDLTVEMGNFATSAAASIHDLRYQTIPREINKVTAPLRGRITRLENVRKLLDGIAKKYGYADFPTLVRTATPHIKQLIAADVYVKGQHHASLAGALSVYEATAKSWAETQRQVQKLGYYTIPDFVRWAQLEITKVLPAKIEAEVKARQQLATKLAPLIRNEAPLLALLTVPGFERAFNRIRNAECTPIAECAVNQNFGSGAWGKLLNLLKDLLETALAVLAFADLCNILAVVSEGIDVFMPVLEELVTLESGICAFGGASPAPAMAPPAYRTGG